MHKEVPIVLDGNRARMPQRMTVQNVPQRPEVPDLERQCRVEHREDAVDVKPEQGTRQTSRDEMA